MMRSISYPVVRAGIIPPYMFQAIEQNGSESSKSRARKSLDLDYQFRAARSQLIETIQTRGRRSSRATACADKSRKVYSAQNKTQVPGLRVRVEGQDTVADAVVNEVYEGFGVFHDFLCSVFKRNSLNGRGMGLVGIVHYRKHYANALWDSIGKRALFGDGDGVHFNRPSVALDVIAHELTHGLTFYGPKWRYFEQPGALSESISDVFGVMVKQYHLGQGVDKADWLIGAGIFTATVKGTALRSLKAPGTAYDDPILGKDPQPATMASYVPPSDQDSIRDFGGVHINCGIPNHAFYTAATIIGGNVWETTGKIWYNAIFDKQLKSDCSFKDFAALTHRHAEKLCGSSSREALAVAQAWATVGIDL